MIGCYWVKEIMKGGRSLGIVVYSGMRSVMMIVGVRVATRIVE